MDSLQNMADTTLDQLTSIKLQLTVIKVQMLQLVLKRQTILEAEIASNASTPEGLANFQKAKDDFYDTAFNNIPIINECLNRIK